jgi:hypothetical protein
MAKDASHLGRLTSQWILVITDGGGPTATRRLARLGPAPSLGDGYDDVEEDNHYNDDVEEDNDYYNDDEPEEAAGTRADYLHYRT